MRAMPGNSVDSIVTDPPYGLGFMGKEWDELPPGEEWAAECLRVLKPGGHLLAFGGTRTWHRLACAVEDAGFEIRDSIAWLYGSGFPKSLNVSKAIDKAAGAERDILGVGGKSGKVRSAMAGDFAGTWDTTAPATDAAREWQGWGTALKPAFEPVVVARKPIDGTVAANVLEWGTGALNIDGCRIAASGRPLILSKSEPSTGILGDVLNGSSHGGQTNAGRWPANVILDESQADELDQQSGNRPGMSTQRNLTTTKSAYFGADTHPGVREGYNDNGGASRFFYVAKAPKSERPVVDGVAHATVKPLTLMRHLVRLVTPPGGLVLDPFAGSGTTAEAAILEGFRCVTIEKTADYLPLIVARIRRGRATVDSTPGTLFDAESDR